MTLNLTVYVSDAVETSDNIDDVINDITVSARLKNAEVGVTGVLFYMDGRFLQILEGKPEDVQERIDIIKDDPRHENFEILIDTQIEKRGFKDWNMEGVYLKAGKEFSRDYIRTITRSFANIMVPESDVLADFYKSLMQEKTYSLSFLERIKNFLLPPRNVAGFLS